MPLEPKINFCVLTLFPEIINGGLCASILRRALDSGVIGLRCVNPRDFALNKHKRVDDYPYGGGAGMVIQAQPIYDAYIAALASYPASRAVYLTPQGKPFDQRKAEELACEKSIILLCGHYEGIDERVIEEISPDEISIGDYVLTGGELAALVVIDAVSRLIPGVLGKEESFIGESFTDGALEYPQYTRPFDFMGRQVPEVLLSGHHKKIDDWRREQSLLRTMAKRPELLHAKKTTAEGSKTMIKYKLNIEGMSCPNCVKHVEKALKEMKGASEIKVDLDGNCAYVCFNGEMSDDELKEVIDDAGYELTGVSVLA